MFRALRTVDDLTTDVEDEDTGDHQRKLAKTAHEFGSYLAAKTPAIPQLQRTPLRW